jgi:TRAP-type mannitol/chloroaromatic compound transport system permease large subunit
MVFMILIGAALFSLVFRGFEGDEIIIELLSDLPGGKFGALFIVMLVMFLLGFVLDFIEITFVIVPIVGPVLLAKCACAPKASSKACQWRSSVAFE